MRTCQNIRQVFSTEMHIDMKHSRTPVSSKSSIAPSRPPSIQEPKLRVSKGREGRKGGKEGGRKKENPARRWCGLSNMNKRPMKEFQPLENCMRKENFPLDKWKREIMGNQNQEPGSPSLSQACRKTWEAEFPCPPHSI